MADSKNSIHQKRISWLRGKIADCFQYICGMAGVSVFQRSSGQSAIRNGQPYGFIVPDAFQISGEKICEERDHEEDNEYR